MLSQGLGGSPAIFASHRAAVGNAQISKNRLSQKVLKYIKTPETVMVSGAICGASDLTRTGDLLITSEMHYRLCYTSISLANSLYPELAEMSTAFSDKPPISAA